jgi:phenylpropionate dioxygenase-like ring-hydroxylating dioxygenase large terminal subunit
MKIAGDDLHLQGDFLLDTWYVAAWDHELIDGRLLGRTILEQPVLLYKGDSGRVVALDERCCHRGARLSKGRLEGDCVRCMYHGLKFDSSGACVQIPGQDGVPKGMGVKAYPVVERDHLVWIWMGDAAKADTSLIIDFPYLREPGWRGLPDYLHYDANYLLIVDNLSDFAHLAFVHAKTLGGSEEYAFKTKPVAIERLANGFRVKRWHMNAEAPPFHRKVTRSDAKIDRWNVGTMFVPGIFFLESGFAPAGSGAEKGDISQAKQYRNCQFFTPETRRTTHFFWNYLHNYELQDPNIARSLRNSMFEGFNEDKAIIEAQQAMFEADPQFRMHPIAADAPLAHFRRLLAQAIAQEREAQAAA